jgi:heat shock protein 4
MIEGLLEDIDYFHPMKREDFEKLSTSLLDRVLAPVKKALTDAELSASDIFAVEIVGGGSRIPAVQAKLKEFFGKELSVSLNGDDAVGLGTTLFAAKISPAHRMREFILRDANPYSVIVRVAGGSEADASNDITKELFPLSSKVPVSKRLTFSRDADFDVFVDYSESADLPVGTS